ncbi:MAG: hypothetical protein ACRD1V_06010 [Vicinamibacterales bacterium]
MALLVLALAQTSAAHGQTIVSSLSAGPAFTDLPDNPTGVAVGGGVEKRFGPLALGGEMSDVYVPKRTTTFTSQFGVGTSTSPAQNLVGFSFKASYYPLRFTSERLRPFVAGGLSVFVPANVEGQSTLDGGGGFDWWAGKHAGLRVEARAQIPIGIVARCGLIHR